MIVQRLRAAPLINPRDQFRKIFRWQLFDGLFDFLNLAHKQILAFANGIFQVLFNHQPKTCAKINGATIVASDSMMNFGVFTPSLPQVIFSFGTAPE
jgi:hypothetical protein